MNINELRELFRKMADTKGIGWEQRNDDWEQVDVPAMTEGRFITAIYQAIAMGILPTLSVGVEISDVFKKDKDSDFPPF